MTDRGKVKLITSYRACPLCNFSEKDGEEDERNWEPYSGFCRRCAAEMKRDQSLDMKLINAPDWVGELIVAAVLLLAAFGVLALVHIVP